MLNSEFSCRVSSYSKKETMTQLLHKDKVTLERTERSIFPRPLNVADGHVHRESLPISAVCAVHC